MTKITQPSIFSDERDRDFEITAHAVLMRTVARSLAASSRPTLLHNPTCSKSRAALAILQTTGLPIEVREYVSSPLDLEELHSLRKRLRKPAMSWMRGSDSQWADRFGTRTLIDDPEGLAALVDVPSLLERPIFVHGCAAIVGRPPELVLALAGDDVPADDSDAIDVPRYAVCRLDKHGEYDATVAETPSMQGAERLVHHYRATAMTAEERAPWEWPLEHMVRRIDLATAAARSGI